MQDVEPKNAKDAAVDQDQRRAATWPGGKSKVPTKVVQKKKRNRKHLPCLFVSSDVMMLYNFTKPIRFQWYRK